MWLIRNNCYTLYFVLVVTLPEMVEKNSKKPSAAGAILKMRCPNCRKGSMYTHKSIFPLSKMMDMPEECPVCGQKMELQVGFYYGTGYVSYALSVALFVFNLVWYWTIFGLSYKDNSIFYYLITSISIVILLQPLIMRYSRVLYIYMFVKYGSHPANKPEEGSAGKLAHHPQAV